jgi:hypothetical protein
MVSQVKEEGRRLFKRYGLRVVESEEDEAQQ